MIELLLMERQAAISEIETKFGSIDVLINNAGWVTSQRFETSD